VKPKLSYANVMSTLAVFLALGGGGFAIAAALEKNSVGSRQVKKDSLTRKDLKNGKAVGSEEVIDESLGAGDLAPGAVGSAEVADGSLQPADLAPDEAVHVVGAAGEPSFGTGGQGDCLWIDYGVSLNAHPVSFYRDRGGTVHLDGLARSAHGPGGDGVCDASPLTEFYEDFRIFTLPPGYRPPRVIYAPSSSESEARTVTIGAETDQSFGGLTVPAGAVIHEGTTTGSLFMSGIQFRTGADSGL
jgi:hypothetical protein